MGRFLERLRLLLLFGEVVFFTAMESLFEGAALIHPVMEVRMTTDGFVWSSVDVMGQGEPVEFTTINKL